MEKQLEPKNGPESENPSTLNPVFTQAGILQRPEPVRDVNQVAASILNAPQCTLIFINPDEEVALAARPREDLPADLVGSILGVGAPASVPGAYLGTSPDGPVLAIFDFDGQLPWSTSNLLGNPAPKFLNLRQELPSGKAPEPITGTPLPAIDEAALSALALWQWRRTTRYCPQHAETYLVEELGWALRCPQCRRPAYPRIDPAMIVAVLDQDDRLLLGNNQRWPEGRFSLLAGYVEAGESAENAVRREVFEEVKLPLPGPVRPLATQVWPFPRSLMLLHTSRIELSGAQADQALHPDPSEIREARFFSREQYREEVAAGTITPPAGTSIARAFIRYWLAGGSVD
ncbi:hypothetical protein BSR29_02440 [Boudabousia liubingyangii]|uniref:NAD(+) diphosphatase n=1 Tax=Boudabousia liubingyangii TaxID=1921764 RepID=A0A1Q5PQQ2_9ACTO|nr:NAD(+) diphosphatase [Boudabousia liubingyangii]OKL49823.1 hypothetical protein BSR29_02440 [Boudabousia liubingyangii]